MQGLVRLAVTMRFYEKDFSLSLEMTVRVKRYSSIASFPTQERLFPLPLIKASHSSAYQKVKKALPLI